MYSYDYAISCYKLKQIIALQVVVTIKNKQTLFHLEWRQLEAVLKILIANILICWGKWMIFTKLLNICVLLKNCTYCYFIISNRKIISYFFIFERLVGCINFIINTHTTSFCFVTSNTNDKNKQFCFYNILCLTTKATLIL